MTANLPVPAPTQENYQELQHAYEFFNVRLFGGELKPVLFTLQRERRTLGYVSRHRFVDTQSGSLVDELALNPSYWPCRTIKQTLSTLVHEQCHLWQYEYGKPSRSGYHNMQWSEKMESVGLMPSHTGQPGGRRTGEKMTHYIIQGGPFDLACDELLTDAFTLSWLDRHPAEPAGSMVMAPVPPGAGLGYEPGPEPNMGLSPPDVEGGEPSAPAPAITPLGAAIQQLLSQPVEKKQTREKYVCPRCQLAAHAKPGALLYCGGKLLKRRSGDEWLKHEAALMISTRDVAAGADDDDE